MSTRSIRGFEKEMERSILDFFLLKRNAKFCGPFNDFLCTRSNKKGRSKLYIEMKRCARDIQVFVLHFFLIHLQLKTFAFFLRRCTRKNGMLCWAKPLNAQAVSSTSNWTGKRCRRWGVFVFFLTQVWGGISKCCLKNQRS